MPQQITIKGQRVTVGDNFFDLTPEQQDATVDEIAASMKPEGFMANAMDFVKSIPRGLVGGLAGAANPSMAFGEAELAEAAKARTAQVEPFKETLPAPQGGFGKVGEAVGEGLGSPASYLGPGGAALKIGGAALSSAASEGARQGAEGTVFEKPASIAGALAGGVTAGKAFGPGAPKAAIPTSKELLDIGDAGYKRARASGLEVEPTAVSTWATTVEQELTGPNYGFTGGRDGVAPKTLRVINALQNPPRGAIVTASNLDTLRKNLGEIAKERRPPDKPGGVAKPTSDAAAAAIAKERLGEFTENLPQGSVVAGNAADYVREIKQANANWAAGQRTGDFDARLTKAERATDRQIAGSLDAQIKTKAGQLLDNPRGLAPDELAQLKLIETGGPVSNTMRQLGRGGAGVIPIMAQLVAAGPAAMATGGLSLIPQALLAGGLYGARKGSEAITKSRAEKLAEMLAKRSPEYESRAANLPPSDTASGRAAVLRSLLNVQ